MTRFALALMPLLAVAQPAAAAPADACAEYSEVAFKIMLQRQSGVPVGELVRLADRVGGEARDLIVAIIDDAYASTQWASDQRKIDAATEFAAMAYTLCRSEGA